MTAYNAYQAYSGSNGSSFLTISVTGGASHSRDEEKSSRKISNGSEISAGNDLNIIATGKGKASNIDIIGSNISAGNNINLSADNKINLIAASDDSSQNSKHSGNSWGVGVAATIGDGISFGITANASASAGYINGNSTSWQYSHANAGNQVNIYSGGDTNLIGGIISGKQVNADIGGDLNIESLQDLSKYKSQDLSAGGSVTIGYGFSASGSASFANINNDYASVQEQAGIKAGDGGFNIKVKGNTELKGAVIESSQSAIDQHKNRLETNSLSYSDITNHAVSKGGSVGVAGGYTSSDYSQVNSDGSRSNNSSTINANGEHKTSNSSGENVNTPVVMASSDSDSSSTKSGISGGELIIKDGSSSDIKRDISSETEQSGAINNNLDLDKIQAGFAVSKQLVEQIGVFEANKAAEADAAKKALKAADEDPNTDPNSAEYQQLKANVEQADKWQPGGEYGRVISAFSAAATGNATGGSAQLIQAAAVNYLQTWAVTGAKDFVDDQLEKDGKTTTGEAVRTALQGLVACAGASANRQNCSAAATGAASSVVINNLIDYANNLDGENLSAEEKQQRKNLVNSLIAGIATAANNPQTAATATGAADMEMENNALTINQIKQKSDAIKSAGDKKRKELIEKAFDNLDGIQQIEASACVLYGNCQMGATAEGYREQYNQLNDSCKPRATCSADTLKSLYELDSIFGKKIELDDQPLENSTPFLDIAMNAGLIRSSAKFAIELVVGAIGKEAVTEASLETITTLAKKDIQANAEVAKVIAGDDVVAGKVTVPHVEVDNSVAIMDSVGVHTGIDIKVVNQSEIGMKFGGGINEQGMKFEDFVAKSLPKEARVTPNFKTIDFFDLDTKVATSVKTLDTTTAAKIANPKQIYSSLKGNIDKLAKFEGAQLSGAEVEAADIKVRELVVGVPAETTPVQWVQIKRAIDYAKSSDVVVKIIAVVK